MTELKIAQLGEGLTEVLVVGLLASAGAEIARDQPLLEVETDKAVMTIEAPGAGRLVEWRVKDGERVAVGEVFAVIEPVFAEVPSSEPSLSPPSLVADLIGAKGTGLVPVAPSANGTPSATGNGSAERAHFAQSIRAQTDSNAGVNGHGANGHGGDSHGGDSHGGDSHGVNGKSNGHAPVQNGVNGSGARHIEHLAGDSSEENPAVLAAKLEAVPSFAAPQRRGGRNGELSPRERARLKSAGQEPVPPSGAPSAQEARAGAAPLVLPEVPGAEAIAGVEVEIDPALEAASNLDLERAPATGALSGRQPSPYFPTDRQVRLRTAIDMSSRYTGEATISSEVSWDQVVVTRRRMRAELDRSLAPLAPEVIAWSAVRALRRHPRFRLINGGQKGYFGQDSVCFGMAVALPDDELGMATVENADTLTLGEFIAALRSAIRSVKAGVVSPGRAQFHLSYMATHGVDYAIPRVVYPAVATLFVGAAREVPRRGPEGQLEWCRSAHFVLSFDHHVINGAGAARFLRDVATGLEDVESQQS